MDMVKKGDMMSIEDVVDILSINLIGAVPDDENIVISTNQGEPLVGSDTLAGKAYMNICRRIIGEDVPLLDLNGKTGLFELFKKKNSGGVAKDRLKLLLVSDRANCSPDVMEMIKNDIINVISKYMDIDVEGLDIQITQTQSETSNGTVPALFANIPIKDLKNRSKQ